MGLVIIAFIVLLRRDNIFTKRHPWYLYLGGAISVLTIIYNNVAFSSGISVSAILALILFGDSLTGLVVDSNGLFGMTKRPFFKHKIIGLVIILVGIASMLEIDFTSIDPLVILAIILSCMAGMNVVISRTVNARLASLTNVRISAFYNYVVGSVVAIIVFIMLGRGEMAVEWVFAPDPYIYLGGAIMMGVVLLNNITAQRISAFYLTLLVFVAQIFSGITVDILITGAFSSRNLIGGVLVAFGLCVNLILDRRKAAEVKN